MSQDIIVVDAKPYPVSGSVQSRALAQQQGTVRRFGRTPFGTDLTAMPPLPEGFSYVSTENAADKYLATLGSANSVITVRSKLNQFARFFNYPNYIDCDWELMRYENVMNFLAHLKANEAANKISTVTINAYLCALKGVAQAAWNLNQITDHDLMRIKSIRQYRVSRKMAGRALSRTESRHLLSICDDGSKESVRDRAILLLLIGCGLRRAEITKIEMQNVFLEEGRIRLIGKGNKERDVFMNEIVQEAVTEWIDVRHRVIADWNAKYPWKKGNAGDGSGGYLFGKWSRNHGYLIVSRPLNPWTVGDLVTRYKLSAIEKSGLSSLQDVTTHDLRRTFATRLLDKGVDINVVKNLMGHSNIATTSMYDRRGDEAMKQASIMVDV